MRIQKEIEGIKSGVERQAAESDKSHFKQPSDVIDPSRKQTSPYH